MSICTDCGRSINRGTTSVHTEATRCMVCQVGAAMQTFKYKSRAAKLYALGKQAEGQKP